MLKTLTLILLLLYLLSCKRRECPLPIVEIEMINKAKHCYGGKSSLTITDKEKINKIESLLKKLKTNISNKTSAKNNFGFIEILYSTSDCKNVEYFNIVFTKSSGDLIHYNSDNDFDYEYFKNDEIVQYAKTEMMMLEDRKSK
ncbi:hypothetical protein [Aquimarina sp. AU119]|uniref:hypothetical protein n=1 Tax=Aquimarina sp. AU119 TaxID=2108528 RepID=UPI0013577E97|nr:hypothetical protein [Aquimarina sp. AU119]